MLAIVLARNDWREYDQIISLYTLDLGKVDVLARGVKKILSKNSSFLEPGNIVEAEVIPGKELSHLGSVQPINASFGLKNKGQILPALSFSLHIFSCFATHQEKDERLFKFLYGWLGFLEHNPAAPAVFLLDVFVVRLLSVIGFDIAAEEKVGKEIGKDLELIRDGNWDMEERLKFEGNEAQILHNVVFQFCLYHAQKRLDDWAKLAYFSGKC